MVADLQVAVPMGIGFLVSLLPVLEAFGYE
jgi:hypothetical protein